jgi:hypothetical protein
MNQIPDPDVQTCPSCSHPITAHTPDGLCHGWVGVTSHPCDGLTAEQVRQHRDDQSNPRTVTVDDRRRAAADDDREMWEAFAPARAKIAADLAARPPLDPAAFGLDPATVDDQATHPARNAHDLTVAASTLRGAATLARDLDVVDVWKGVAEWLEQLARAFDTERDQLNGRNQT